MIKTIHIRNREQAEKINALACGTPYEVWLATDTVMLDARSLLSLMTLVGKRAKVVVEDDVSPKSFDRLVRQMG